MSSHCQVWALEMFVKMKVYAKVLAVIVASHCVRWAAEYAYFTQCAGFWNSIFSWNSPTCIGLRWVSDSVMANMIRIVGSYAVIALNQLGAPV